MFAWRGVFAIVGAFMVHLTLGTLYTFGNMSPYIASYLRLRNGEQVTIADMTWINAAMVSSHGLLMCVGGLLDRRLGPLLTSAFGCIIMSSGVALTYYTINMSFIFVVLTYGVMFGCGISIAYISLLTCGMKWFPQRKGLVNGIIVGGFGLGAFIFNPVQTAFLNSNNVTPSSDGYFDDDDLLNKVPTTFLLLALIYAVIQFVGCLMVVKAPPVSEENLPLKGTLNSSVVSVNHKSKMDVENTLATYQSTPSLATIGLSPLQIIKTKEFYLLWFTFLLNTQSVTFCNSMYKAFGLTFISDDYFLAMIGAVASVFNASGRIFWGVVVDRSSYKVAMRILCICVCLLLWTLPATSYCGTLVYGFWICVLYFALAGTYVLIPVCTFRIFGPEHYGSNYGLVFSNGVFSGPLTALLAQFLMPTLNYVGMFYLLSGFSAISFLLTCLFQERFT